MEGIPENMDTKNSHVGQLAEIVNKTIVDGYALLQLVHPTKKIHLVRDQEYLSRRASSEGLGFLTTTLPLLGDWFDECILKKTWTDVPRGFYPTQDNYPLFLFPFWQYLGSRIIENLDANEVETYCKIVRIVRTILYSYKKLSVPFTEDQVASKLETFLAIEDFLDTFEVPDSPIILRVQMLLEDLFEGQELTNRRPKHGPGAVSGGERGTSKWDFSRYWHHVHTEFPLWDLWPLRETTREWTSRRVQLAANAQAYRKVVWESEAISRMLFVPKDSRGPRIIACEPKELMYVQQGVLNCLVGIIRQHFRTRGHVNFDDQTINARLALEASTSRANATIDLSDASDRVSCQLVKVFFPEHISRKLLSLRSTHTQLPSGEVVKLNKFAAMGSALCFPVESLCFWAICVATVWEQTGDLAAATNGTYVFGDDLIVPDDHYDAIVGALEMFGLKVNSKKSLHGRTYFRESCGTDAYYGHLITPLRIQKLPPRRSIDSTSLVAWTKYAEASLCFPSRSSAIETVVSNLVGPIPRVHADEGFLSIVDPDNAWSLARFGRTGWDSSLCYHTFRGWKLCSRERSDHLEGWSGIQDAVINGNPEVVSMVVSGSDTQIRKRKCLITTLPG